jgi:hypothetical protein
MPGTLTKLYAHEFGLSRQPPLLVPVNVMYLSAEFMAGKVNTFVIGGQLSAKPGKNK